MTKAYVFGPISFWGEQYLPVYQQAMLVCSHYFDEVIGSYPDFWESDEDPRTYYQRIRATIPTAGVFIGEFSQPSHGVGMEIQMSCEHQIPLIALVEEGRKISKMILGVPNLHQVIQYRDLNDLAEKLDAELKTLVEQ